MVFGSNGKQDGKNESASVSGSSASGGAALSVVGSNGSSDAYLGRSVRIVGNVSFATSAEVDGQIEGEIQAKEKLVVGEGASIKASIHGAEVIVKGTVIGDITATRRLTLKKPAKVTGNISSPNLSIEEGVVFEGKCAMTSSATSTLATTTRAAA